MLLAGEGEQEHAYLCDFGLVHSRAGGSLTGERAFLGTASYAAPEQIRGEERPRRSWMGAGIAPAERRLRDAAMIGEHESAKVMYEQAQQLERDDAVALALTALD